MSKQRDPQLDINRRRILRGMAGAPVVMTLANGAHGAATSSLVCIANNADALEAQLAAAFPPPDSPDANGRYCVDVGHADLMNTEPFISGAKDLGPGTPIRTDATGSGTGYDNQWCVEYVDLTGAPKGYDSTTGVPVTASCYTSFTPV